MTDDVIKKNREIHIGLIPDGNRRYAVEKGRPAWTGHWDGAKKINEFVNWSLKYPEVKRISIFALSRDNLGRTKRELKELWKVYKAQFQNMLTDNIIKENSIRIRFLGDDGVWGPEIKDIINQVVNSTKHYSKHILNIMLAYGSEVEITRAIKNMADKPIKAIERFLLVKEPLDLLIRTGDQFRLSDFMLYQAGYAEIYFSKTMWPDFTEKEFRKIMKWYYEQARKFGR